MIREPDLLPRAAWGDPLAVRYRLSGSASVDEREASAADEAMAAATWMLDSLTGGAYHAEQCLVDEYDVTGCCLTLWESPVSIVERVSQVDVCPPREATDVPWCVASSQTLDLCGGCGCSCGGAGLGGCSTCGYMSEPSARAGWPPACGCRRIRVGYRVASTLPPGMQCQVETLAAELAKSCLGRPCALPERVTNVTRQGVSWTVFDPQDYLERGLTGIASVDQFVSAARRSKPTARMIDPLKGRRVLHQVVACDGDPFSWGFSEGFDNPEVALARAAMAGAAPLSSTQREQLEVALTEMDDLREQVAVVVAQSLQRERLQRALDEMDVLRDRVRAIVEQTDHPEG